MSKTNSRKGYAVGALVALVSTLFTFAPAQADANGPVTLLPTAGTTFNTIIGSPIELVSTQDPATVTTATNEASANATFYVISNPAGASIKIGFKTAPSVSGLTTFSYLLYADGVATSTGNASTAGKATVSGNVAGATFLVTTTEKKIAVSADTVVGGVVTLNTITLDATVVTKDVALTVQTLVDTSTGAPTTTGIANGFDRVSKAEAVILYAAGSVTATTVIRSLVPTGQMVDATVVYGNSVNPFFVHGKTSMAFFKDGQRVSVTDGSVTTAPNDLEDVIARITSSAGTSISAGVLTVGYEATLDDSRTVSGAAWGTGIFSAQAYYNGLTVGAASAIWDGSAGPSSLVDNIQPSHVNTLDAKYASSVGSSASELLVRSGTKTVTITGQLYSSSTVALAAANVEVKAVVGGSLDATSTITVTGAPGTLVKGGSAMTAYARTDTDGKVSFTITSTTGKKGDAVSVRLYAKANDGTYVDMQQGALAGGNHLDVDVVWQDGAFSTFAPKPANYTSGANPTVTFKVADQFGKGLSAISGNALSVYAVASFGGVQDSTKYSGTAVVVDGEVSFTFPNFAPAGGLAQLQAELFTGGVANSAQQGTTQTVNVYNTAATSNITVVTSFTHEVSYKDYVTGDTEEPAVAKAVADAGLSTGEGVAVTGNVLNASGVGQPGVAVTVAAPGVLFEADGVYSLGTISTNANEFGAFSVTAIAHTVYARGTTVTITADGQTATTQLVTYIAAADMKAENLNLSWTLPANVVKNVTYAVTLKLTDKWGNPVAATTASGAVKVQGVGSVEVNSSANEIGRSFDRNGEATVFLRSVKDIAGPGSLTATLVPVFSFPTALGAAANSQTIVSFITTDAKATAWDESKWSNTLTSNVEVLDVAPAATGKVNVGSFNGKLVVYAAGLDGAKISWKVAGRWGTAVASGNLLNRFDRPVGASGVNVLVDIYVNGVKQLSKSVLTR